MIGRIFYFFLLAVLALGVVLIQLDRQAYNDPGVIAAVPEPVSGVARQRQLEMLTEQDTFGELLPQTRDLVRKRPLPARHLVLFARSAELAGERDAALAALEVAAVRGWREPGAQLVVAQAGILSGNYEAAAQRLAALSATGAAPDQTNILLAAMLAEPDGRSALADLLTEEGAWKFWFVQRLRTVAQEEQFVDTIAMAWEGGAALDCDQLRPAAQALVNADRQAEAQRIWRGDCASQTLTAN